MLSPSTQPCSSAPPSQRVIALILLFAVISTAVAVEDDDVTTDEDEPHPKRQLGDPAKAPKLVKSALSALPKDVAKSCESDRFFRMGLVADSHYDTFPAGERAPWEAKGHWRQEQQKRTTATTKRRYDVGRDKMIETVDVFNKADVDVAINLGDLINNDLMWNTKPILAEFAKVKAPKFSLLGNHDLRAHNDRFGKNNKTQERWLKSKLGLTGKEWFYTFEAGPFYFIVLDSIVVDELQDPRRKAQLAFLAKHLEVAKQQNSAVIILAHISIGIVTNYLGPTISKNEHVVAAFFGHEHKGGYTKQGHMHSLILNGQIETLMNAFAVADVFCDRIEVTGFGRMPTYVLKFTNPSTVAMVAAFRAQQLRRQGAAVGVDAVAKKKDARADGHDDDGGATAKGNGIQKPPPLTKAAREAAAMSASSTNARAIVAAAALQMKAKMNESPFALPEDISALWPTDEALQVFPPLQLNIPSYRKPALQAAHVSPGATQFRAEVSTWPVRVMTHAPEALVDLTSDHRTKRTWIGGRFGVGPGAIAGTMDDPRSGEHPPPGLGDGQKTHHHGAGDEGGEHEKKVNPDHHGGGGFDDTRVVDERVKVKGKVRTKAPKRGPPQPSSHPPTPVPPQFNAVQIGSVLLLIGAGMLLGRRRRGARRVPPASSA